MAREDAARRRLLRILNDETYGPKLVRLNRRDQREILDLIDRGETDQARKLILHLDEERRKRRRVQPDAVVAHMMTVLDAAGRSFHEATIRKSVMVQSTAEQRAVLMMDGEEIAANAGDPSNIRYEQPLEEQWNRFWYR